MVGKGGSGSLGHGEDLSNQLLPKKIEVWSRARPPTPSVPASSDGEDSSGGEDMDV